MCWRLLDSLCVLYKPRNSSGCLTLPTSPGISHTSPPVTTLSPSLPPRLVPEISRDSSSVSLFTRVCRRLVGCWKVARDSFHCVLLQTNQDNKDLAGALDGGQIHQAMVDEKVDDTKLFQIWSFYDETLFLKNISWTNIPF